MDIRIGNDIKLNVTLPNTNEFDQNNVRGIKAYLVNQPMEEFLDPTASLAFNGHCCDKICGPRGYHFPVFNAGYRHCYDHHRCCGYHHCGWRPFRFDNGVLVPNYSHSFCRTHHHFPQGGKFFSFLAPTKVGKEKASIEVYFPAKAQIAEGDYRLILVIEYYEYGWGRHDIKTDSLDYGIVFRLGDDDSYSGSTTIDVVPGGVQPSDQGDITGNKVIKGYIGTTTVRPSEEYGYNDKDQSFDKEMNYPAGAANVNLENLTSYDNITGVHAVNTEDGEFLWIVAESPITQVSAGTFEVPLSEPEKYNNLYYYAALNPLKRGVSFNITIGG